tara:strand:- start:677 stop:2683 length:2007 start_codon:yes stop_codon:yes gene_type:complete
MASLTGKSIASTYPLLLKIQSADDNNTTGIDGTLRFAEDGDGTASALKISTAGIQSTGTLAVSGTSTLTGDVTLGAGLTVGTNITFGTTATSFTGANRVVFKAQSGQDLNLRLEASNADQNTDNWQVQIADGDAFKIMSKATGAYISKLTLSSNGDVVIDDEGKLRLDGDGGGDTYIVESSDNVIDFYAGGTNALKLSSTHVTVGTNQLSFTSTSGTEIAFSADNIANVQASGGLYLTTGAVTDKEIHLGTNGQTDSFVLDSSENVTIQGNLTAATSLTLSGGASRITVSDTAHNAVGSALSIEAGDTTAGTTDNIAGGALNLRAGRGKGSGAGGDIVFQVANASTSGSVINSWATALTISDDLSATFTGYIYATTQSIVTNSLKSSDSDLTIDSKRSVNVILDSDENASAHAGKFIIKDHDANENFIVTEDGNTTVAGTTQLNGTLTIGVDGTGYDTKFFGDTSGSYMLWDQSHDALVLTDSSPIKIGDGGDMQIYHNGSHSFITNSTGTMKLATENSGIAVSIGHTTSETTVNDNLTVTGTTTSTGGLTVGAAGTLVATRDAGTLINTDGDIPTTGACAKLTSGGAVTGARFATAGTAGQILFVNNAGGNPITFHNTEGTALLRGVHADHDTMETMFMGMFVSDGTYWNLIAGGVDSQPDVGLTAS